MLKAHNPLDVVCPSCKSEHTTFLWENDYAMYVFSGCIKCKAKSPEYYYGNQPDIPAITTRPKEFNFDGFDNAVKALNQYLAIDVYNCSKVYVEIITHGSPAEQIKTKKNLVKHFGSWLFDKIDHPEGYNIGTMTLHLSNALSPDVAMKIGREYHYIGYATDSFLGIEAYTGPLPGHPDDTQCHLVLINYNTIVTVDLAAFPKPTEASAA